RSELSVKQVRNVFLQSRSHQALMQHPGDSISLPIYVKNTGNTTEAIQILTSRPISQGSSARDFEVTDILLSPSQDTILNVGFILDERMLSFAHFYVNVTGLYSNKDVFGNATINVQNAASRRSFVDRSLEHDVWSSQQNQISLSTRNLMQGQQTWHLQG